MPALKWLRLLMNHIPDKYQHLVRYYGYYSSCARCANYADVVEQLRALGYLD
jgi:hypothetical protein